MHALTQVPAPINETVLDYAPGSPERAGLEATLADLAGQTHEFPHTIGGKRVHGTTTWSCWPTRCSSPR